MKPSGPALVFSLLFALAVGAGAASYFAGAVNETNPADQGRVPEARVESASGLNYDVQIAALASDLEQERAARERLSAEVASLENQIARIEASQPSAADRVEAMAKQSGGQESHSEASNRPRSLDVGALVAAGFAEETVREYQAGLDQMELDRLYLRDIATREGWINTARFREENEALRLEAGNTREKYGEEFYDWMLYTTGHNNRVEVGSVMVGSAAEDVGLRGGDQVVSYDGERVFSPSELRDATVSGEPGELVPVEVTRNGRPVRVMVPRGPLGVRVEQASVEPGRAS